MSEGSENNGNGSKFSFSNPLVLAVLLGGGGIAGGTGIGSVLGGGNENADLAEEISSLQEENKSLQEAVSSLRDDLNTLKQDNCQDKLDACELWKEEQTEKRLQRLEKIDQ